MSPIGGIVPGPRPPGRPAKPTASPFGTVLRGARLRLGRTLKDAAGAAGVSAGYWSKVERGVARPAEGTADRMLRSLSS